MYPFVDDVTKKKLAMTTSRGASAALANEVDMDALEAPYGGNNAYVHDARAYLKALMKLQFRNPDAPFWTFDPVCVRVLFLFACACVCVCV